MSNSGAHVMSKNTTSTIASPAMDQFIEQNSSLIDVLRYHAETTPDKRLYTYLYELENKQAPPLTFAKLDERARALGAYLTERKLKNQRAILIYAPNEEFIVAFMGCLYAGVIAVPVYPPMGAKGWEKLVKVIKDCQANVVLSLEGFKELIDQGFSENNVSGVEYHATDILSNDLANQWKAPAIDPDQLAFLQYTSGSTGDPKGVMVSHLNLIHNIRQIATNMTLDKDTVFVSWLPVFHDMGLIGKVIAPMGLGASSVIMTPSAFIRYPHRWLKAISEFKGTCSGGPNFAFELCIQRIKEKQLENIDLSSWHCAFNGAEPVRANTLDRFYEKFAPYGFRKEAIMPVYGMAETTLMVSGDLIAERPHDKSIVNLDSNTLTQGQVKEVDSDFDGAVIRFACEGISVPDMQIEIVNPDTENSCKEGQVGEIWLKGPNIAKGYWQKDDLNKTSFAAKIKDTKDKPFLRTGDLGFKLDDRLYVTGRLKDVVIIRGRNHYPQDIELTAEQSHSQLRKGCGAAFSIDNNNEEHLVVVQEIATKEKLPQEVLDDAIESIRQAVSEHHQLQANAIILIKRGSISKTTSGKIQRYRTKQRYLTDDLTIVGSWHAAIEDNNSDDKQLYSKPAILNPSIIAKEKSHFGITSANELIQWLRNYAENSINSELIDENRTLQPNTILDFGNHGLLGMQVPPQYGGLGLNDIDTLRVIEQVGAIDQSLGMFVLLNNILGVRPIMQHGSEAIRKEHLPLLACGRELAAFALTESETGLNPNTMATSAHKDNLGGWTIEGTKTWTGSGSWSGLINVFARTFDENGESQGVTSFLVDKNSQGLNNGPGAPTIGMRGIVQNTVYLDGVSVDDTNILGQLGHGTEVAQETISYARLAIAALALGGMKRCTQLILRYVSRQQFGAGRLLENPVVLMRIGDITSATAAVETLIYSVTSRLQAGLSVPLEAFTACKVLGTEFFWHTADDLVQMLGARGYIETNMAPRILRDARVLRTFQGATEALSMFVGSCIKKDKSEFYGFIKESLETPKIAKKLDQAIEKIANFCNGPQRPFSEKVSAHHWEHYCTGQVTIYALLWACVQNKVDEEPLPQWQRVREWAKGQFEQKLNDILTDPEAKYIITPQEAVDLINQYQDSIGDIEQYSTGQFWQSDILLKKDFEHAPKAVESLFDSTTDHQQTPQNKPATNKPQLVQTDTSQRIQSFLIEWLNKNLGVRTQLINVEKSLTDYGVDSLDAEMLAGDIGTWLDIYSIKAENLWDAKSISELCDRLAVIVDEKEAEEA